MMTDPIITPPIDMSDGEMIWIETEAELRRVLPDIAQRVIDAWEIPGPPWSFWVGGGDDDD